MPQSRSLAAFLFALLLPGIAAAYEWRDTRLDPRRDVPSDSWTYAALGYLQELGYLECWPAGYFSGDPERCSGEFIVAIGEIEDALGPEADPQRQLMIDALRGEFSFAIHGLFHGPEAEAVKASPTSQEMFDAWHAGWTHPACRDAAES